VSSIARKFSSSTTRMRVMVKHLPIRRRSTTARRTGCLQRCF